MIWRNKIKNNLYKVSIAFVIIIEVIILSIGYFAFNNKLSIKNVSANVGIDTDIRITEFSLIDSNSVTINNNDYDNNSVSINLDMNNYDSYITYKVKITNFGNVKMGIYDISGLPDELEYEIEGYDLKGGICNDVNECTLGISKEFNIKIKYKENINTNKNYSLKLNFDFRKINKINYISFENDSTYPKEIISGDKLEMVLDINKEDLQITMNDVDLIEGIDYTYENNLLLIPQVTDNINIIHKIDLSLNDDT